MNLEKEVAAAKRDRDKSDEKMKKFIAEVTKPSSDKNDKEEPTDTEEKTASEIAKTSNVRAEKSSKKHKGKPENNDSHN